MAEGQVGIETGAELLRLADQTGLPLSPGAVYAVMEAARQRATATSEDSLPITKDSFTGHPPVRAVGSILVLGSDGYLR